MDFRNSRIQEMSATAMAHWTNKKGPAPITLQALAVVSLKATLVAVMEQAKITPHQRDLVMTAFSNVIIVLSPELRENPAVYETVENSLIRDLQDMRNARQGNNSPDFGG